jgi:hypothetical protein
MADCPSRDVWGEIALAKHYLDESPHLANYILRDLPETKAAGLSDLAWGMHRGGCHKNDVLYLIELLEQHCSKAQEE